MKTIVTACGVGYASSVIIAERIRELLEREGLEKEARILQTTLNEVPGLADTADLFVTSSPLRGEYPAPVLNGVPFLSGIGMEELEQKILAVLRG